MAKENFSLLIASIVCILFCIIDFYKNIKLHALRTTDAAIASLHYSGSWSINYVSGKCDKVNLQPSRSICFNKIILLYMKNLQHKKILLLLVGEALSDEDWRRLHKYLKILS